jgi:L-alanine-DL-glutamate epimerase-like enolase superfamily enzyme
MLSEDVADARDWYNRDTIHVPSKPGLGIAVDVEHVRRFSDAWWTVEESS